MTTPPPATQPSGTPPPAADDDAEKGRDRSFGEILRGAIQDSTVTITVLALFSAAIIGGLLAAFTNTGVLHAWGDFFSAPGNAIAQAWDIAAGTYVALFQGSVFNPHTVSALFQQASFSTAIHDGYLSAVFNPLSETAVQATPLILTGLAVALPYQAGLFNIGGQSQFIGGAIVATWLGYAYNMPFFVHVVVCVIGAFVGGAALGGLAGELKARTGAHEVITTIMLNYVMLYFLAYVLSSHSLMQAPGGSNAITLPITSNAHLPLLAGTHLRINAGFLIALAAAFAVWWLLNRTTTGFEFRSVGSNASASRVAGMNVERNWTLVMTLAGGLAGLAAASVILGTDFTLNPQSYGTYGIDAITVALLGLGRPGGVVLAGLLFGALHAGSPGMQTATGTPVQIVQVLQALIVLFVAAPPLVRTIYRVRAARARGVSTTMSKGWNA
jgi:ABC-type uncharacterized transport system permease subunit